MDYLQIANSPTLWIACAIPVLLIAFQAVIFVCKSLNAANALGITKHQINSAVRSSAIASFGPSVVVAIGALGLVLAMGGPISWLRLSFIGAVQYELTAATFGAQAANELLNIAGVKASFVLTPYNNEVYVSARAIDEVNVQVMMERMGGGGHLNIAGAQVKATEDETEKMIKDIIDQLYQEGEFKE